MALHLGVCLGEKLVQGSFWRTDHHQEDIENEERDGKVIEKQCLLGIGPDLVGSPEQKGRHEHARFDPFR